MDFKSSKVRNNDRTVPNIVFDKCNDLILLMEDWFGNNKTVSENMGLLMFKLGILSSSDDIVRVYNFDDRECSFSCAVNYKNIYNIKIKNLNRVDINTEIEVLSFNVKKKYECIPVSEIELGMRVIQREHSIYQDGVCYTRGLFMDKAVFIVRKKNYVLEFGISKPNDVFVPLFGSDGRYSKYELDNECDLIKYLKELSFTESVVDIYKKICEISLSDISDYPRMFIKLYIDNFKSQKVIGLIHLVNGQLEEFGMAMDDTDRIVFIDKDDNWSYEVYSDDSYVKMNYDVNEGRTNCNLSVNSVSAINTLIIGNMENARKDVSDVKVKVRKIFDETRLKCWRNMDSE